MQRVVLRDFLILLVGYGYSYHFFHVLLVQPEIREEYLEYFPHFFDVIVVFNYVLFSGYVITLRCHSYLGDRFTRCSIVPKFF